MELISNKVDHSLKKNKTFCPFCRSGDTTVHSHFKTLVGGNPDPNHHTLQCSCNKCGKDFIKEHKYANVWYSETLGEGRDKESRLLIGRPNCFEGWVYSCSYCGGGVRREYKNKSDGKLATVLRYSANNKKDYVAVWTCDKCGREEKTEEDYPGDGVWNKRHINIDTNLWESEKTYKTEHYKEKEKFDTKNVLRFMFSFNTRSIWYSNNKNEWSMRIPFTMHLSLKKVQMYWSKDWNNKESWVYHLAFRAYENVGMAFANARVYLN